MKYRFIDHTADIAFEIYGKDLAELLLNATLAFYDSFVDVERIDYDKEVEVEVEGEDEEILLYRWLNELLYLFDTQFFAAKDVVVDTTQNSSFKASGRLKGGIFKPEMVKVEPKAITMHKFRIEKNDGYKAFVVIDI